MHKTSLVWLFNWLDALVGNEGNEGFAISSDIYIFFTVNKYLHLKSCVLQEIWESMHVSMSLM